MHSFHRSPFHKILYPGNILLEDKEHTIQVSELILDTHGGCKVRKGPKVAKFLDR